MASLKEIKKRIGSVKSTQKITKAMKMVAAAKLRRAQIRAHNARDYTETLVAMAARLSQNQKERRDPLTIARETVRQRDYLVLTSDRGLCGPFNTNLLRQFGRHLEDCEKEKVEVHNWVCGKKGRDYFKAQNWQISETLTGIYDHITLSIAEDMALAAIKNFQERKADEVYLVFNFFKSAMTQEVRFQKLLPILPKDEKSGGGETVYEPSAEFVLDSLLRESLVSQIYSGLLESVASELASRMTAMESATKNASEMIDILTLQYNRARQAAITTELMDIVNGAEALN